jgi:LysR family nitrogen assimilation transcriptional regulator
MGSAMDVRALRYFVHVAEARSFSKAAAQLRVAQPALSRQVRKLESELGIELIDRSGRQIGVTDAGQLLLSRAHSLIRQFAQTSDDVRAHGENVAGSLTIGVSPATCEVLGPHIVEESRRRYPGLRLNFVEGFSRFIFEQLVNQELTLCLMHDPPRQRGIEIEPLIAEPMYLVGPGRQAQPSERAHGKLSLRQIPLILPNRTHGLRMLIERALAGRTVKIAAEVDGFTLTKAMVAAGLGYTILPYNAVHQQVKDGAFSAVPLQSPKLSWTLSLAFRSEQRTVRTVNAVRAIIRDQVAALVKAKTWRGELLA